MYNATLPEMSFDLICKSGSEFDPDVISEVCHRSFSCLDLVERNSSSQRYCRNFFSKFLFLEIARPTNCLL